MVEHLSDDDLRQLRRGGHDYRKLYAAYATAVELKGAPVVILAKTVKGWALGQTFEGRNVTHQMKKLSEEELRKFRDRLELPIEDEEITEGCAPYYHPGKDSQEIQYMIARRHDARGVPSRSAVVTAKKLELPKADLYEEFAAGLEASRLDDDGVRPTAPQAAARQEGRRARRPDHPRRGSHVRDGVAVPRVQDLCGARPAVRPGRLGAPPRVSRRQGGTDPRRGDHRGRFDGLVHRRRDVVRDARRDDDPVLHLLFDVRLPDGSATRSGRSPTSGGAGSCWEPRTAAPP